MAECFILEQNLGATEIERETPSNTIFAISILLNNISPEYNGRISY